MPFDIERAKDRVLTGVAKQAKRIQSAVESKIGESDESLGEKRVADGEPPHQVSDGTQYAGKPTSRSVDPKTKWLVVFVIAGLLILGMMSFFEHDDKEAAKPATSETQAQKTAVPAPEPQPDPVAEPQSSLTPEQRKYTSEVSQHLSDLETANTEVTSMLSEKSTLALLYSGDSKTMISFAGFLGLEKGAADQIVAMSPPKGMEDFHAPLSDCASLYAAAMDDLMKFTETKDETYANRALDKMIEAKAGLQKAKAALATMTEQ